MHFNTLSTCLFILALSTVAAHAEDVPLNIKTDLKGKFFLVEKAGSSDKPTLLIKSVSGDYSDFTKREFDCSARTSRYLSTGASQQQMAPIKPEEEMLPIKAESINDQLFKVACPE